jgi:hypothetical protein
LQVSILSNTPEIAKIILEITDEYFQKSRQPLYVF